ncbi:antibiotic biosynthesis monooxygenase [Streptacidiphilus sp. PB12-B1b]|uniref:antibiotic biosynthesis monooxygenase family protein n=1 Tax=Streptacidiphilus sp. PB12-B1b TaxID=2705012 RepID=UPI0015FA3663|nr:antibiotic biosynthesis monooxygenase family protein [Streptacidiphilus sp. PB12-B1b]QMU78178.1 antibiotic biosynthesis monooxygenase [Streptacidiphilus sp. PB12-B1b]
MPDGTFRVLLQMRIKPGMSEGFEQEWRDGTEAVTGHPANLGQRLARSTSDENDYFIISDWLDEEGFRAFEDSGAHVAHRERLHAYRASATFATMRIVAEVEGAGAAVRQGASADAG